MANISKINSLSRQCKPSRKLTIPLLIFLTVCIIGRPAEAETSIYTFDSDQSTVIRSGGIAGLQKTFSIAGQFRLTVDSDTGEASFEKVDADLTDETGSIYGQSLDEIFNMTGLAGTIIDDTTIEFKGKTADGTESDVSLNLTIREDSVHLTGETTPPPNSADMFFYELDAVATRKYAGGTGEPNDPYQIATAEDLVLLGESPEDYDKHFILTADIDLDPNLPGRKVFDRAVIAPDTDSLRQYFQGTPFRGTFDGNGHAISHLTITGGGYWGLFGELDTEAEVKDLGVVDVDITGSGFYVGGLVGENYGKVTNCYSTGTVSGDQEVGGLVGGNGGNVIRCYSTTAVSCAGSIAGGLVGMNWGAVSDCYSTGDVSGTKWDVGGLVGDNSYGGTVTNCYSTCTVSGDDYVGGLVGDNLYYGSITTSYSTSVVSGTGNYVGGLVGGGNNGGVIRCFWDTQTSGQAISAGAMGRTTPQMQTADTFLEAGWDFVGETENGTHEVWQMPEGGGYPVLSIFHGYTPPQLQGTGTREDPYIVSDALELGAMYHYSPDVHYRLTCSIDLSGVHWAAAIVPWFAGTFDGNNHTIMNLNIDGGMHLGLFGRLASGAEISNLGVVNANIAGSGNYVGGLVGGNGGNVTRCYSIGSVGGSSYVGGLAGDNGGTVTACYSSGTVSGVSEVGGLVGDNFTGNVSHCYSMTSVAGSYAVGGLGGSNEEDGATRTWRGHVSQCYSTGSVEGNSCVGGLVGIGDASFVMQSFWNTETSDQVTSAGGTGKTTAEMQTATTFLKAGWDFVDETANGTDDVWWILEGQDYPRLWWEASDL